MLIADMTRLDRGATARDTVSLTRSRALRSPQQAQIVAAAEFLRRLQQARVEAALRERLHAAMAALVVHVLGLRA
jgi:hypothetical protein